MSRIVPIIRCPKSRSAARSPIFHLLWLIAAAVFLVLTGRAHAAAGASVRILSKADDGGHFAVSNAPCDRIVGNPRSLFVRDELIIQAVAWCARSSGQGARIT